MMSFCDHKERELYLTSDSRCICESDDREHDEDIWRATKLDL